MKRFVAEPVRRIAHTVTVVCWLLLGPSLRAADESLPRLYLIGGSTMATFPETRPVVGWGQMLPKFFKHPEQIDNRARSGRSTKSFIDQGHWDNVIRDIRIGDYLIMCWGTNDSADDPARRTQPRGDFKANLERFIRETRAKGATPILATSVARRMWSTNGEFIEPPSEYIVVTREVASAEKVPLMEMRGATVALEKSLGVEGSIALHLYLPPGKYDSYPNGTRDDTHYCAHGAMQVAALAVQEIRRLGLPLTSWLGESPPATATSR
jgi:lysophospholipase L1-like esterase